MDLNAQPSTGRLLGTGVLAGLAGLAGTTVMTAFQKLVEMPLTGRADSYAPADLAQELLGMHPATAAGRRRLNNTTHFALGGMWGLAHSAAA